jgi:hypothetical protein
MALFDPLDLLNLGESLAKAASEAEHRTATNRVYYACFLIARDRIFGDDRVGLTSTVKKKIEKKRNISEHEAVLRAIVNNAGIPKGFAKRLSDQLGELKAMREEADYYRDSERDEIAGMFERYKVSGWRGLAGHAATLARSLQPELGALQGYRRA